MMNRKNPELQKHNLSFVALYQGAAFLNFWSLSCFVSTTSAKLSYENIGNFELYKVSLYIKDTAETEINKES